VYCFALEALVPKGVRVPNRDELDSKMATCALFGFAHASFFLTHQLESNVIFNYWMNDEETVEWFLQLGGDNGSDLVDGMVQHIVDMKYTNL